MADLSSYINITANTVVTSNLSATGNVVSSSVISTTGNITGNYILGNGSQLTGLPATYGNANVVANLAALGSNPVSTTGNITAGYILGNGSQLTGLPATYGNANVVANLAALGSNPISTTGNITSGNLVLSGNLTVNGSPIYGVPASYAKYVRTATQTGIVANSVVICNVLENTFGSDISVNTSTGNVTLAPNNTYRIRGTVGSLVNSGNPVSAAWQWRNVTGNGYIGTLGTTLAPAAGNYNTGASQIAEAVFTPSVTTVLQLTVVTISNGSVISTPAATNEGGVAWIDIEVIGGQAPVTSFSTTGNVTGNYFIGNGSQLTGLPATYGNSNVTTLLAALGSNTISSTGNVTTTANISGGNIIVVGTANTGISAVVAGATNTLLSNTVAGFTGNVNNYTQVTFQNKSTGTDATADFILTADNGSDVVNYGDFGIINSGYDNASPTNSLGNIVFAADTYLYAQGNTSNASQAGGNLAIGTTVPGKNVKIFAGGITNSSIIANIGNTGMSVTGNVTASNFIGNISITGNVTGTSANVSLVAGSYTATFDNTGVLTLPTNGGDEGGELRLGVPATNTTLQNRVTVDVYQDRVRIFEGSANAKGVYVDISQSAAGVGTLLNNRVGGLTNAGSFVTMDNLKATVTTSGNRGLSLASVSGTFTYNIGGNYATTGGSGGIAQFTQTATTTASTSIFGWHFPNTGEISTYILTDTTNGRCYRITLQIGAGYSNNSIIIERLI